MDKKRTPKPIEPHSQIWENEAGNLARDFCPDIYPCGKCKHPVVKGYCCTFCGDSNPEKTAEQEAAWNKKYGVA